MDRRDLLRAGAASFAASALAAPAFGQAPAAAPHKLKIDAYSRHLQWLRDPNQVAEACIEMAFDGLDVTVRPYPGHVDPAKVKTDLPPFVNAIRSHGLIVDTITAPITDADSENAEAILDAASQLGIKHYWWGTFRYDLTKPIQPQIDALKPRVAKLAKLNEKYGMKAMYHNYSGPTIVGNMIFDLLEVLQNFDPRYVSFHYDTGHAVEAGANGTWELGMRAAGPYIGGISFKDYKFELNLEVPEGGPFTGTPEELNPPRGARGPGRPGGPGGPVPGGGIGANGFEGPGAPAGAPGGGRPAAPGAAPGGRPAAAAGAAPAGGRGGRGGPGGRGEAGRGGGGQPNPWRSVAVPLGMGMVDLPKVAKVMVDIEFDGPVEIQAEYPNGGANNAQDKITLPRAMVLGAMKRDLLTLRAVLAPAGLI